MELGFAGRAAIHPAQVEIINATFTPSTEELAEVARIVSTYKDALATGSGTATDETGRMLDEAVVRRARRLLDQAGPPRRVVR